MRTAIAICAVSIISMCIGSTCDNQHQSPTGSKRALKELTAEASAEIELDRLFQTYLTATPEEAKAALRDEEKYMPALKQGREANRYIRFARLHCLAKAMGDNDWACVLFVKVRYWRVALDEWHGTDSTSEIAAHLRRFTEHRCDRMVIRLDATSTKGKGARYWQELPGGPITPEEWLEKTYGREE